MTDLKTTGALRGNFEAIKTDLNESLRLCRKEFDQHNRVMFTITELLYSAIECVQHKKPFKTSSLLFATFDMLDMCKSSKQTHEITLHKFARSFAIFLEQLNGYCMVTKQREVNVMMEQHKINNLLHLQSLAVGKTAKSGKQRGPLMSADGSRMITVGEDKARRGLLQQKETAARLDREDSPDIILPSKRVRLAPRMESTSNIAVARPFHIELDLEEPHTYAEVKEEHEIKKEEVDYDDGSVETNCVPLVQQVSKSKQAPVEVKAEVKEEPLEEPVSDTVSFGLSPPPFLEAPAPIIPIALQPSWGAPSTSRETRLNGGEIVPNFRRGRVNDIGGVACRFCKQAATILPVNRLDMHVRTYHRDSWLVFVTKCPYDECDFRSAKQDDIREHTAVLHSGWRNTSTFVFPESPACPYCSLKLNSFSQFINHMEVFHPRLITYNAKIMRCNTCSFMASHCHEMFAHWLDRFPSCAKGMHFLYETARSVAEKDDKLQKTEALAMKPMRTRI
ncbi:hypothetical protein PMAYCL1PPCAC_31308 [Pristionchus mayeri]|uniref:C2H2-type domain-containing protein n=1 Tax=Pristionchus mayeri TaxID=1317129 RepID=A0AAN5DCS7_9BILA|nr:hypothetical protein PMAYCL1PPCAC_31308 [Pristionchus mayeri]